ncbi:tyrosine-type recombinase/integrase [Natrononativus amylolyticus]|uniref:tyrosine-type recombinase/integrase n=1 Tax=Natrononativus amylolyticus TaxID=2963434 RepID=UPI0020CFDE3E|nr:site-specific integrase [Natrononativus amylolyticus]
MSRDLERLEPSDALDLYLESRDDASEKTLDGQYYRLRAFVAWCDEEGITNLNTLSGRDLYAYRVWRREGGYSGEELKTITLRGDLATLRAFLRFCGDIDGVNEELYDQIPLPRLNGSGEVSDSTLDPDRAVEIVDWLDRYEYASRRHVIVLLLWHTGCRVGELRALDVGDVDLEGDRPRADGPAIHFVHRPESDTPLKNREKGERWNAIGPHVAQVLEDYLSEDGPRVNVTDDYGRAPLVTTKHGRVSISACRDTLYRVTRPCWRGKACPHDRDPATCEATHYAKMSTCPSSRSPHDVRSGRVTAHRLADEDRALVSDRMNASEEILDKHYDRRSERQKAEQRRRFIEL